MVEKIENPVTLDEVRKLMGDDWRRDITNDFIRTGYFSRHMTFHSLRNPYTGGSGIRHRFTRLQRTAPVNGRMVNEMYTPQRVDTNSETVEIKYWGGTFQLDRILADAGTLEPEIYLQMSQLAQSCAYYFDQQCIIGDATVDQSREFSGIKVIAEAYDRIQPARNPAGQEIDIYDTTNYDTFKANCRYFLFAMDEWLASFDRKPTFLMGNARMIACLRQVAREVGVYQTTKDQWGYNVEQYDGMELVTTSWKVDQSLSNTHTFTREEILPIQNNKSEIIAGRFGRDAIYGICPAIGEIIRTWYPNYGGNNVKPVQEAGVEMSAAMVVNRIESIGILSNIIVS